MPVGASMQTMTLTSVMMMMLLLLTSGPILQAQTNSSKLTQTAKVLDDTLKTSHLKKVTPDLGRVLKMDTQAVEKALLDQKLKFSDLALAKFLSDKINQPVESLLALGQITDWDASLKNANISEKEAIEHLDNLQSEVAFLMLDFRDKKKR